MLQLHLNKNCNSIYFLQWEPLGRDVHMNLLVQVCLSPSFLTLCHPLHLSGTLRKIGYLYLCLVFPQTQSPSIPSSLCLSLPQWDS